MSKMVCRDPVFSDYHFTGHRETDEDVKNGLPFYYPFHRRAMKQIIALIL
jgi:hypothetical protein